MQVPSSFDPSTRAAALRFLKKIRQIKAFPAIVSTGGVRPAAKKLCLTPSTVAKSIGQLESDLGAPLFERSALSLRLNAAGRSLRPYAETIAANADQAAAAVAAVAMGRLTTLNISVTPTLSPEVPVEAMANFRSRWPAVKLVFTSGFFSDCVPKLLADKLDISLVMTSRYQHEELSALVEEPLFEVDHGIDALKGRNDALSLSPLSVIEDSRYAGRLDALHPALFPLSPLTVSFFHRKAVEPSPPADFMRTRFAWPSRNGWPPSRAASFERDGDQHVHLSFLESIPPLKPFSKETGINSN